MGFQFEDKENDPSAQVKYDSREYNFYPKTWILPHEHGAFLSYSRKNFHSAYILKPANGSMGMGIRLYRNAESVPPLSSQYGPCVVQEYITNPLLIDGFKFDLRVYVLITSCCPLRIFVYNEGLVRLSAEKYKDPLEPNGESMFRHLTNYSVNRKHRAYVKTNDESEGSKRSFAFLEEYLGQHAGLSDPRVLWRRIRNLVVKTVILAAPHVYHGYRLFHRSADYHKSPSTAVTTLTESTTAGSDTTESGGIPSAAFEILGFDILLDSELKPWLLEVNRSPSFGVDQSLDLRVKSGLLREALALVNIRASDKRRAEEWQRAHAVRRLLNPSATALQVVNAAKSPQLSGAFKSKCLATDWLANPRELLTRITSIRERLGEMQREADLECFENANCGGWRRVYPTMDKALEQRYAKLLVNVFTEFNKGRLGDVDRVIPASQSGSQEEEELQQQLFYLEREAAKLIKTRMKGKTPLVQQSMPPQIAAQQKMNGLGGMNSPMRNGANASISLGTRCLREKWRSNINQSAASTILQPFWEESDALGRSESEDAETEEEDEEALTEVEAEAEAKTEKVEGGKCGRNAFVYRF